MVATGLPAASGYEVWARVREPSVTAAARGEPVRRVRLGALAPYGRASRLHASLEPLGRVALDRLAVIAAGDGPDSRALLSGAPSLYQRLYVDERREFGAAGAVAVRKRSNEFAAFDFVVPRAAHAQAGSGVDLAALVAQGEDLFFNETFGGNGRTCGTCHRAENNFTLDPAFIATLPQSDPLFVAENDPDLAQLENPTLLRQFGLVLANVDGLGDPTGKFVMRSVPHILGMGLSIQSATTEAPLEMTGWAGDGAPGAGRLRDFPTGAVVQHFTRTLDRQEGIDFRLPTEAELDALEAFTLSLGRQQETDLTQLTFNDPSAERGREMFLAEDSQNNTVAAAKCNICHRNGGARTVAGVNGLFDTGVEDMAHPADLTGEPRPIDGGFGTAELPGGGFGDGTFNTTSLWEAADTAPFFHHNAAATLEDAIAHYESDVFRTSPEGQRLQLQDSAGRELTVDVDFLAAFLRAINVMENIRSATAYIDKALAMPTVAESDRALMLARAEIDDAMQVMLQGELHVEDAYPLIENAAGIVDSARVAADPAERDSLLAAAGSELQSGRDIIVVDHSPAPDVTAPTVTMTSPADGATVAGQVLLAAAASDDTAVANVTFSVAAQQMSVSAAPFEAALDTTTLGDGVHVISVVATDASGNSASAVITVTVDNASAAPPPDTTKPTVTLTAPADGQTVSGTVVVSADAVDASGIAKVTFKVGTTRLAVDKSAPYQVNWDTTAFGDGSQTVKAIARDSAGNVKTVKVVVTVNNAPVVCTVYSCPTPPPPPSEPPPPPVTPPGASPDGELAGTVTAVDLQASTVSVDTGGGTITLKITSQTQFMGSISTAIHEILPGQVIQGEFFSSVGELLWVETDLPPGF